METIKETPKPKEEKVSIEYIVNKLKITPRDAYVLKKRFIGELKKESEWTKVLKQKGYIL